MNNDPKILLTVVLEGGALHRVVSEPRKWYLTKKDLNPSRKFKEGEGNKIVKSGRYRSYTLEAADCNLKTTLTKDAYDYMVAPTPPDWYFNKKAWGRMNAKERLEVHLNRICQSHRGKSFTYQIIESE